MLGTFAGADNGRLIQASGIATAGEGSGNTYLGYAAGASYRK